VSLFAVFLSILITILLTSRITRPISQLKNSAAAIIDGNFTLQVPANSNDEIGQLADIFNQMTRKLQQSFAERDTYRDHLEELVTERTAKLQEEIHERRQIEAHLTASEEHLRLIIDQSPMGIILWDTHFHVRQWNHAAETIFGYSEDEASGLPAEALLPQSMHQHMDKIWHKMATAAEGIRSRNENVTREGKIIQCDWFNTAIVDSSGKVLGALSLIENVTERSQIEKEILKLEKLESTGLLAGGIAHDFNNILTGILGNINLAQLSDNLPDKTRNLLIAAEKASIRAKSLTQQLLTFAKGGEPIKEATCLKEVIEDSASFVLRGGTASAQFILPDDLWHARVDRDQFSQVIQNIVLNARHAMPQGGTITIEGKNIHSDADGSPLLAPGSRYIRIAIRDMGVGIPQSMLDKIFDPYFSTKQEGSGLGLAITLSIIQKHEGHIQVLSTPEEGTEFVIYLPATQAIEAKNTLQEDLPSVPSMVEVMIMEDDSEVQDVLTAMLSSLGYKTTVTSSGEEALLQYREKMETGKTFDLVIADLTIPGGMGGKEAMDALLVMDPAVRAIVSSGYSNDPVMSDYRKYGFRSAITKPYILQEVKNAIARAFSSKSPA
ncbi:MAG: ATP-binding protein, partial [Desulfopila sp.]|jgi:PAS domain S-box-containing protein|nr:ATP-binding protein [Desulfopila sp.]